MLGLRKIVPALAVLMLLAGTAPVSAASLTPTTSHYRNRYSVHFTITPATCPDLPVTVTGTGDGLDEINVTVYPDGSSTFMDNATVKGTAVDSEGATYHFSYNNHTAMDIAAGVFPVQVAMNDTFILAGNGGANHLNVGFNWRWTANNPDELWPPSVGWDQVSTRGIPLGCDPL